MIYFSKRWAEKMIFATISVFLVGYTLIYISWSTHEFNKSACTKRHLDDLSPYILQVSATTPSPRKVPFPRPMHHEMFRRPEDTNKVISEYVLKRGQDDQAIVSTKTPGHKLPELHVEQANKQQNDKNTPPPQKDAVDALAPRAELPEPHVSQGKSQRNEKITSPPKIKEVVAPAHVEAELPEPHMELAKPQQNVKIAQPQKKVADRSTKVEQKPAPKQNDDIKAPETKSLGVQDPPQAQQRVKQPAQVAANEQKQTIPTAVKTSPGSKVVPKQSGSKLEPNRLNQTQQKHPELNAAQKQPGLMDAPKQPNQAKPKQSEPNAAPKPARAKTAPNPQKQNNKTNNNTVNHKQSPPHPRKAEVLDDSIQISLRPPLLPDFPAAQRSGNYLKDMIVLTTATSSYIDFTENWLLSIKKLGGIHPQIYIIAEDKETYEYFNNRTFKTMEIFMKKYVNVIKSPQLESNSTLIFDTVAYKNFVNKRPQYILDIVNKGFDVLFCDVDIVWFQRPYQFFAGQFDMYLLQDQGPPDPFVLCAGFMMYKSTNETKRFIERWIAEIDTFDDPRPDQVVLNRLFQDKLRIKKPVPKIKHKVLDPNKFVSGRFYFNATWRAAHKEVQPVILHNNWIVGHDWKVERFKRIKKWYL